MQPRTPLEDDILNICFVLDYFFVFIFLVDVALRIYIMGLTAYCYDTLCFLDLLVSSIDVAMIVTLLTTVPEPVTEIEPADDTAAVPVGSMSTGLRLFRVVRIVRITKAIRAAKRLLERKKNFVRGMPTPTTTSRYDVSEFNNTVTDFKLGITRVLEAFMSQMMDFELSDIVLSRDWKNLENKMRRNDMDLMAIANETNKDQDLTKLLIDLIMYKRPAMSEAALNLLFSLFFEECALFSLFHQTQLIEGTGSIAQVRKVRSALRTLQNAIETYEVWIRDSDKYEDETESLCELFQDLKNFCQSSPSMQDVMRDSGAMRTIEQCLQDILLPEEYHVEFYSVSQLVR